MTLLDHYLRRHHNQREVAEAHQHCVDYLIHDHTHELHSAARPCHALLDSDFSHYVACQDTGRVRVDTLRNGVVVPVVDLTTGATGTYFVDKCELCYPQHLLNGFLPRAKV